jgi:hypothetical protein
MSLRTLIGDALALPLANNSVDTVVTSHCLGEPYGGPSRS